MKFLTLVTPDLGNSLLKMKFLIVVTVKMKFQVVRLPGEAD